MKYFEAVGIGLDIFLCAILTGQKNTTLSLAAARGAQKQIWFACVFCKFLSWLVQRDHCADQLDGISMGVSNYARAFVGLVLLATILASPVFVIIHFL